MNMNSMCALLITSKSHVIYYEDSFIDHCITLDTCLHYSGSKAIVHGAYYSLYTQLITT